MKQNAALTFPYNGKVYKIVFFREKRTVHVRDPYRRDVKHRIESLHPFTVVKLLEFEEQEFGEVRPTGYVIGPVAAGCFKTDYYTPEEGRLASLRLLTKIIAPEMRPKLWHAYLYRPKGRFGAKNRETDVEKVESYSSLPIIEGTVLQHGAVDSGVSGVPFDVGNPVQEDLG